MNRFHLWLANNLREGTIFWFLLLRKAQGRGYHIRRLKSGRKVFVKTGQRLPKLPDGRVIDHPEGGAHDVD